MSSRQIESAKRCKVIAEVAQSHEGSLGLAHAFIDAVASTGADGVKFQTHIAEAESTIDEPWRIKFSLQDETRFDYWKRMEFTEDQWRGLRKHAHKVGLSFLSSPFSLEAFELLNRVGVCAWKIASGEVNNFSLIEAMLATKLPVILSTGMSAIEEIDIVVSRIKGRTKGLTLLQCTTQYPCGPEQIGLNLIPFFRDRYECGVGLSDHSGTIFPGLAAAALGADMLEVHVTLSREMFGPDVAASVTVAELRQLVEGCRFIAGVLSNPVDKDAVAREKKDLKRIFGKNVVAANQLSEGTRLKAEHLVLKKAGGGLGPDEMKDLIGRRLRRSIQKDQKILREDYE